MKTLSVKAFALFATVAIVFAACNKQSAPEKLKASGTTAAVNDFVSKDGLLLAELFTKEAPQSEFFTIQPRQEGNVIGTKSGTKYNIRPLAFTRPDGSYATGPVTVTIKEIFTPKDFVLANRPTATRGEYLTSFGEFFVRATENGVDLRLNAPIVVQVAAPRNVDFGKIPLWEGDTTATATLSGFGHQNQPVSVTIPVAENPGVDWSQLPTFALFNSTTGTLDFELTDLLRWTNCDILNSGTGPKTTVLGYFNIYNNETQSTLGEQPSQLFFKPRNINSVVKFYNLILAAPAGFEGFLSYQNIVAVGQQGTFLAITALNGQFYAELRDVTIGAPAAGTNYFPVHFNLQPVSGATLLALIAELNNR
jgi:hypothetical protein